MNPKRNAIEDLLAEGMAAVEQSFTFAKAAQPEGQGDDDDLENDFKEFDKSKDASDASAEDQDSGEGDDEDEDDSDSDSDDADWNGDKGGKDDGGQGKPFAKASQGYVDVDAAPLLQAIDEKLGLLPQLLARLEKVEEQNVVLAKAVQESARGNLTIAKAVSAAMGQPLQAKSQQARVPIARPVSTGGHDKNDVMAKAIQAVEQDRLDVDQVAVLEELTNRHGIDAALAQLPVVAKILNLGGN